MSLTQKTLAFFGAITKMYDADYIVKVDDDVFLRIDRLPYAFKQWDEVHAGTPSADVCITPIMPFSTDTLSTHNTPCSLPCAAGGRLS